MKYDKVSLDAGNAQIKIVTDGGEKMFPHALFRLGAFDLEQLEMRGELEHTPNVYCVNGDWYSVGVKAIRKGKGAAVYGEARYRPDYYGVLAAISMFEMLPRGSQKVFLFGSHTPKDIVYRDDLVSAVCGHWVVESCGQAARFHVVAARGFEEPVGAYRHATLSEDGMRLAGDRSLQLGDCLICDIGGWTTGLSLAIDGRIEYEESETHTDNGVLNIQDDFEQLVRQQYRGVLKGANQLNPMKLRSALIDGVYDAAALGMLDVKAAAEKAREPILRNVQTFYEKFGGAAQINSILAAGGGTMLFWSVLCDLLQHPRMFIATRHINAVSFATARGGMQMMRALEARGKL